MNNRSVTTFLGIALALFTLRGSVFTVAEWQLAVKVQFGEIISEPIQNAGLYFKLPFVQEVRFFDKRILSWDGKPSQVPTQGKYIIIDTTARYRIADAKQFIRTVQSERTAYERVTSILEGKTKNIISRHALVETVRNTNKIIDKVRAIQENPGNYGDAGDAIVGEIPAIEIGREKLSRMIVEAARRDISEFGIELIDVLITRVAYEPSVEKKVFERMISERNRVAEKILSEGKGEKAKIEGKLNKDLKSIQSEAYRQAQGIRGEAKAESTKIYADALAVAPDFYEFSRTLDAYKTTLPEKAHFLLSTHSEFFKLLRERPSH